MPRDEAVSPVLDERLGEDAALVDVGGGDSPALGQEDDETRQDRGNPDDEIGKPSLVCVTNPGVPHGDDKRYAVVSCHVERPLDDAVWARFSRLQERAPGGFRIAALMRPPDQDAGDDEAAWLARACEAASRGPFGLHTHWTSPSHARPTPGGEEPAARVRREVEWLRAQGMEPTLFAGGGWYMDDDVADTLADVGLVDCTGTAFTPSYLSPGAPRLAVPQPKTMELPSGRRLAEIPATHSLGMLARSVVGPLPPVVHAYFHDTDLLDRTRAVALSFALRALRLRRQPGRFPQVP